MMVRFFPPGFIICVAIVFLLLFSWAGPAPASRHDLEQLEEEIKQKAERLKRDADALFDEGELEGLKEMIGLYEQILSDRPDNFESNWKMARGCRFYADLAKRLEISGWEDIAAEYGKKGMEHAERAIELEPERPEGYYYYGLCAASYSDGVGLFTAISEGLKNETRNNLEKAYEIDRHFAKGGPILALGRFWQVVPWPYNDREKALKYYRQFQETEYFDQPVSVNARVWMSEILIEKGGGDRREEARRLLEKALELTDDPYWEEKASAMLKDL